MKSSNKISSEKGSAPKVVLQSDKAERALISELAARRREALRLYEPMPWQEEAHACRSSELLVRKGNRAGGSMFAAVEIARAVTHTDPYRKYPTDVPIIVWVVGYGLDHIGRVFHRLLFKTGAFKVIKDEQTKLWRAYRPWQVSDRLREREVKPAQPLIPSRLIESSGWSWRNKGSRIFHVCRLKNGNEIRSLSSESEPPQGDPVDLIWVDEDLARSYWIPELEARLSDRKGRLIWTAFPHSKNDALVDMSERAEAQRDRAKPDVVEVRATFSGNPHIDDDEKRKRLEGWSDEERRARDYGDFMTDAVLMYPSFHRQIHGMTGDEYAALDQCKDWCRYMIVDPGHTCCGVLFAAVSPPSMGFHVLLEDCLKIEQCDASKFADQVVSRAKHKNFHAFIIDWHGSRGHEGGSGLTIAQQYGSALARYHFRSHATGFGFVPGSDDRPGRAMAVREWLSIRANGTPTVKVLLPTMQPLIDEFARYRKEITNDRQVLEVATKRSAQKAHLCATLEYLAAYRPRYHVTPTTRKRPNAASERYRAKKKRRQTNLHRLVLAPGG